MKKVLAFSLVSLLVFTGCGKKDEQSNEQNNNKKEETGVITCTTDVKDVVSGYEVSSEYKINYKGEFVESVETIEIVTSESDDILEYFEENTNILYEQMDKAYGGYTYEITKSKNKVTTEVKIDYTKMDLEQLIEDQPSLKNYSKDNKLTVEGIKAMYETIGATCE